MQVREDSLQGRRPECPRRCQGRMHWHTWYERYASPDGLGKERIQRWLCPKCGVTVSVLPGRFLPYRSVHTRRLQVEFDRRAGLASQGPDPPPSLVEAGCLERAWSFLSARVDLLLEVFGQLLPSGIFNARHLWRALRQTKNSVANMLRFLSEHHSISLLGNYRCLRPPA